MGRATNNLSLRAIASVVALFVAYFVTAKLGLMMDAVSGFATLVWPPTGIALYALFRYGYGLCPGVFAGALVVNALAGAPIPVAMGIAVGNTLEALLGAALLRRLKVDRSLGRVRDVLALVFFAAIATTAVSASVGVASLRLGGVISGSAVAVTWRAWWLGDVLGALTVAPLLLVLTDQLHHPVWRARAIEAAALLGAILLTGSVVYADIFSEGQQSPLRQSYVLFPVLIWAALRFGQPGAATATFLVSAIAVGGTALGQGPFVRETLSESLYVLQAFMGVSAVTTLILGAAIAERDRAKRAAEQSGRASELLAKAGKLFGISMDYQETLQSLARLVVPALADNCVVHIVEEDGSIRQVAEASTDPLKESLLFKLRNFPPGRERRSPVTDVLKSGKTLFVPVFTDSFLQSLTAGDEYTDIVRQIAPRTSVTIPLVARNRAVGAISFGMAESGRNYSEWDLALAEELGRRAALAVDNVRLFKDTQQAVRARDEFLSVASHELRTPLTTLELQVATLERAAGKGEVVAPDKFSGRLDTITRQLHRLSSLVENLLDVSRISSGRLSLDMENVDLAQVVREVLARFSDQLIGAGCELLVDLRDPCGGQWDRMRLEQIITNLLSNAVKYAPGKPVEVRLKALGESCALTIKDNGIGIAMEDQARIFKRFERAASQRHYSGLGLGLWIVNQIVGAMGGHITVKSQLGAGSEFTVILPRILRILSTPAPAPTAGPRILN